MSKQLEWPTEYGNYFAHTRVLITGGAGFIGSHLAEALAGLGASVVVLDDMSGGAAKNLDGFRNTELIEASILDRAALARAIAGCRFVFHQAALGSVPRSVEQPQLFHEVNSTGTLNVLEAARKAGVDRVMFAASSSAYGDNPVPWVETMPVRPQSPYAANKVAGEALFQAYSKSYGFDTVALRYFNIFGPRQNANSAYAAVIAAFAKALLAGKRPIIHGDGQQSRDFTYVANAIHANLLAATNPTPLGGSIINVGCGASVTVLQLAHVMAKALGREDLAPLHEADRPGDLKHSYADLHRAATVLGYKPVVDFGSGLDQTLEWYKTAHAAQARAPEPVA